MIMVPVDSGKSCFQTSKVVCCGKRNNIHSFQGCSFLVIFGLPGYKHEQDCAYALQCSVSMADSLHKEELVRYADQSILLVKNSKYISGSFMEIGAFVYD